MPKPKTPEQLKEFWRNKLARSGFTDIEDKDGELKSWTFRQVNEHIHLWDSWEPYFRLVGHFLHDHEFESREDRLIWEHHAKNVSVRDIVKKLKQRRIKISKTQVWETIVRLRDEMKKMYKVEG